MQIIESLAVKLPLVIACVVFLMAAIFKVGKETGAGFIAAGAVVLGLVVIINPLVGVLVMPRLIKGLSPEMISYAYLIRGLISSLCWAGAIALVATGTFLRSPSLEAKYENESVS
jgi:hypothetical protein